MLSPMLLVILTLAFGLAAYFTSGQVQRLFFILAVIFGVVLAVVVLFSLGGLVHA